MKSMCLINSEWIWYRFCNRIIINMKYFMAFMFLVIENSFEKLKLFDFVQFSLIFVDFLWFWLNFFHFVQFSIQQDWVQTFVWGKLFKSNQKLFHEKLKSRIHIQTFLKNWMPAIVRLTPFNISSHMWFSESS